MQDVKKHPISREWFLQSNECIGNMIFYWNNPNNPFSKSSPDIQIWLEKIKKIRELPEFSKLKKADFYAKRKSDVLTLRTAFKQKVEDNEKIIRVDHRYFSRHTEWPYHIYIAGRDQIIRIARWFNLSYWQCLLFCVKNAAEKFFKDKIWLNTEFRKQFKNRNNISLQDQALLFDASINSEESVNEFKSRTEEFFTYCLDNYMKRPLISKSKLKRATVPDFFRLLNKYGFITDTNILSEKLFCDHVHDLIYTNAYLPDIFENNNLKNIIDTRSSAIADSIEPAEIEKISTLVSQDYEINSNTEQIKKLDEKHAALESKIEPIIMQAFKLQDSLPGDNPLLTELIRKLCELRGMLGGELNTKSISIQISLPQSRYNESFNITPNQLLLIDSPKAKSIFPGIISIYNSHITELENQFAFDQVKLHPPAEARCQIITIFNKMHELSELIPGLNYMKTHLITVYNYYIHEIEIIYNLNEISFENLKKIDSKLDFGLLLITAQDKVLEDLNSIISKRKHQLVQKQKILDQIQELITI